MTILDFVRMTRANLWVILVAVVAGMGLASLYTLTQPKLYQATATGYVSAGASMTLGDVQAESQLAMMKAGSYLSLATSRRVAERIVTDLGLDMSPAAVAGSLSAYTIANTQTMGFTASSTDPELAARLADAAVRATAAEVQYIETIGRPEGDKSGSPIRIFAYQAADQPRIPYTPNWRLNLMVGAAMGVVAGYVIAFVRRSLDGRLRHMETVEQLTGTSVLGVIPKTKELLAQRTDGTTGTGVASEALRQLRTNLRFVHVDNPPRSIVISSCNPGEGKSTISANLARVIAESGQPTLLVDADLRRPTQHRTFQVDNMVGLTQVLAGDLDPADVILETNTPNLFLIPAGRIPPNPSELVGSQRMRQVVASLTDEYFVIVDAPPLLPVTDAGLLAVASDGAILVMQVGKTFKEQIKLAKKILDQIGGELLGSVLNMAPRRGLGAVVYGYGYGGYIKSYDYYDYRANPGRAAAGKASSRRSKGAPARSAEGPAHATPKSRAAKDAPKSRAAEDAPTA